MSDHHNALYNHEIKFFCRVVAHEAESSCWLDFANPLSVDFKHHARLI